MDFKEFTKQVAEDIKQYLPEKYQDASIKLEEVTKNNDTVLTGLVIRNEDSNIAPNIYLENFFEQYQNGRDFDDILQNIADIRERYDMGQNFDIDKITDYNRVKNHIICKVINAEMNTEYLMDKPHTIMEDLAVIYTVDLGNNGAGQMSAPITNSLLERYGITPSELHEVALENLSKSEIEFKSMRDMLIDMMFPDGLQEDDPRADMIPPLEESPSMYVLTNSNRLNGASVILDKNTMQDIAKELNGDYFIVPSSIHELIVLSMKNGIDKDNLEAFIRDVNMGQVLPEERLSDKAYVYDSENQRVILAEKYFEAEKNVDPIMTDTEIKEQDLEKAFSDASKSVTSSIQELVGNGMDVSDAYAIIQNYLDDSFGKSTYEATVVPPGLNTQNKLNPDMAKDFEKIIKDMPEIVENSKVEQKRDVAKDQEKNKEPAKDERKDRVRKNKDKGMDI